VLDRSERRQQRRDLEDRAVQEGRIPPGQSLTLKWPVLDTGIVPTVDLATWRLQLYGLVHEPCELTWADFRRLPQSMMTSDIHCVTRWTKLDNTWEGVRARDVLSSVDLEPAARYVMVHAPGYTANLPLQSLYDDDVLFASAFLHDMAAFMPCSDANLEHGECAARQSGAILRAAGFPMAKLPAVQAAARRTRELPNVRVERRLIPHEWPEGRYDLIVLSEILYYLGHRDLEQALDYGVHALEPGGTLLAVHWRHPVTDYPRSGDDVHRVLAARPGLARLVSHQEEDFLAEVYRRAEGRPVSVARAAGLV